ncbi:MAG TPA: hypothetical protein VD997_01305 [Phycisphaerales bacterium]|nr:hypothetical protein [Phycisphaerales bacterium]
MTTATTPSTGRKLAFNIQPGESYTIRRKVFKIFGAAFHIYDPSGNLAGYCKQKAFKIKEDIRIYTDESMQQELVSIRARHVLDFSTTYDVTLPDGFAMGSLRRKGLSSTFLRDEWLMFDDKNRQVAVVKEDNAFAAFCRRYLDFVAFFFPQKFTLTKTDGTPIAKFRQHFNPLVFRMSVAVLADDPEINDLVILATGCLLTAIEGRQSGG